MNLLMIQPILPRMPVNPQLFRSEMMVKILSCTLFLAVVGMTTFLISLYATKRFQSEKKKTALIFIGISLVVSALLLCFFGCAVIAVQGTLFCLILLFSSFSDIRTREADDYLAVMIALIAFIGIKVSEIPVMLLSAVLITLPILFVVIICNGKSIGGADVKLSAACAFLLGITKGFFGLITGLTLGIVVNLIIQYQKVKLIPKQIPKLFGDCYISANFLINSNRSGHFIIAH